MSLVFHKFGTIIHKTVTIIHEQVNDYSRDLLVLIHKLVMGIHEHGNDYSQAFIRVNSRACHGYSRPNNYISMMQICFTL